MRVSPHPTRGPAIVTKVWCGKVGTGFSDRILRDLTNRLKPLEQRESPFQNVSGRTGAARGRSGRPERDLRAGHDRGEKEGLSQKLHCISFHGSQIISGEPNDDSTPAPKRVLIYTGYKVGVQVDGGHLIVSEPNYIGFEANCCPSSLTRTTNALDGDHLVALATETQPLDVQEPTVSAFYQGELIEEFEMAAPRPEDLAQLRFAVGQR